MGRLVSSVGETWSASARATITERRSRARWPFSILDRCPALIPASSATTRKDFRRDWRICCRRRPIVRASWLTPITCTHLFAKDCTSSPTPGAVAPRRNLGKQVPQGYWRSFRNRWAQVITAARSELLGLGCGGACAQTRRPGADVARRPSRKTLRVPATPGVSGVVPRDQGCGCSTAVF